MVNGITYLVYFKNGEMIEGKFDEDVELHLNTTKFILGEDVSGRNLSVNVDDISRIKKKYA